MKSDNMVRGVWYAVKKGCYHYAYGDRVRWITTHNKCQMVSVEFDCGGKVTPYDLTAVDFANLRVKRGCGKQQKSQMAEKVNDQLGFSDMVPGKWYRGCGYDDESIYIRKNCSSGVLEVWSVGEGFSDPILSDDECRNMRVRVPASTLDILNDYLDYILANMAVLHPSANGEVEESPCAGKEKNEEAEGDEVKKSIESSPIIFMHGAHSIPTSGLVLMRTVIAGQEDHRDFYNVCMVKLRSGTVIDHECMGTTDVWFFDDLSNGWSSSDIFRWSYKTKMVDGLEYVNQVAILHVVDE